MPEQVSASAEPAAPPAPAPAGDAAALLEIVAELQAQLATQGKQLAELHARNAQRDEALAAATATTLLPRLTVEAQDEPSECRQAGHTFHWQESTLHRGLFVARITADGRPPEPPDGMRATVVAHKRGRGTPMAVAMSTQTYRLLGDRLALALAEAYCEVAGLVFRNGVNPEDFGTNEVAPPVESPTELKLPAP